MKTAIALAVLLVLSARPISNAPAQGTQPPASDFPRIIRFTAQPEVIHTGETAVLKWEAHNVTEVLLEEALDVPAATRARFHSLGTFPASGTLEVRPQATTTYVVSCGDEIIGCSSASVRVRVKARRAPSP